jgi:restriction system protein
MTIPSVTDLLLPILKLSEKSELSIRSAVEPIASEFSLGEADLAETIPSGQKKIRNRISWALSFLRHAGLVQSVRRGRNAITDLGRDALKGKPAAIDIRFLVQYEGFRSFYKRYRSHDQQKPGDPAIPQDPETPEERLASAVAALEGELVAEVKAAIRALGPHAFARLAVEVAQTLRYGSHDRVDAAEAEFLGVKDVVIRDPLGLDPIFLRAFHNPKGPVSGEDVEGFLKAMGDIPKGVLITDAGLSGDAGAQAASSAKNVSLIDLSGLVTIMLKYNVGLRIKNLAEIRGLDRHFFEELEA